jgi:acyl-CoA thioester hydrolase
MLVSETQLQVRYAETDQMGIAHHSNYSIWFEAARTDFSQKLNLPMSKIEAKGVLLPLIELKCTFKNPIRYEDTIVIKTKLQKASGVKTEFIYEIYRLNENDLLASGSTAHAWTNKELKPLNIGKFFPEVNLALQNALMELECV